MKLGAEQKQQVQGDNLTGVDVINFMRIEEKKLSDSSGPGIDQDGNQSSVNILNNSPSHDHVSSPSDRIKAPALQGMPQIKKQTEDNQSHNLNVKSPFSKLASGQKNFSFLPRNGSANDGFFGTKDLKREEKNRNGENLARNSKGEIINSNLRFSTEQDEHKDGNFIIKEEESPKQLYEEIPRINHQTNPGSRQSNPRTHGAIKQDTEAENRRRQPVATQKYSSSNRGAEETAANAVIGNIKVSKADLNANDMHRNHQLMMMKGESHTRQQLAGEKSELFQEYYDIGNQQFPKQETGEFGRHRGSAGRRNLNDIRSLSNTHSRGSKQKGSKGGVPSHFYTHQAQKNDRSTFELKRTDSDSSEDINLDGKNSLSEEELLENSALNYINGGKNLGSPLQKYSQFNNDRRRVKGKQTQEIGQKRDGSSSNDSKTIAEDFGIRVRSKQSYQYNSEFRNGNGLQTQPIFLKGHTPNISSRKFQPNNTNNSLHALARYASASGQKTQEMYKSPGSRKNFKNGIQNGLQEIFKAERKSVAASGLSSVHSLPKGRNLPPITSKGGKGNQSTSLAGVDGPSGFQDHSMINDCMGGMQTQKQSLDNQKANEAVLEGVQDSNQINNEDGGKTDAEKDEEIRKAAWKEMITALKKAREEKELKDKQQAELEAAGLISEKESRVENLDSKNSTLKPQLTGPLPQVTAKPIKKPFKCIIYPDNQLKGLWDIVITFLVVLTCVYAPYTLAFLDIVPDSLNQLDNIINYIFAVDILINLVSAYQDENFDMIDDNGKIARRYMFSWFLIDLLAIIPFDQFLASQSSGGIKMMKISKLTRLYRLIRLARMIRLLKMFHIQNHSLKKISEAFKLSATTERLLMMTMILFLLQHVVACVWVYIAKFNDGKENWIYAKDYTDLAVVDLYINSFYFTVTTIMTVGYGDITAISSLEKVICIFLMLIGVIAFSFATGAISSIISNQDSAEAKLREKMETLQSLQDEYQIYDKLYDKIARAIQYGHTTIRSTRTVVEFMEELPTKVRIELALWIHKQMYSMIKFFDDKDHNFKAWVGTILKPLQVMEDLIIYEEGEEINDIFFLTKGNAGLVISSKSPIEPYVKFDVGDMFGHTDLANNKVFMEAAKSFKKKLQIQQAVKKKLLPRHFTAKALKNCDLMTLGIEDLDQMKVEFPDVFFELLEDGRLKLKEHLSEEIKVKRYINKGAGGSDNLFSKIGHAMMKKMEKDILEDKPKEKEKKGAKNHDQNGLNGKSIKIMNPFSQSYKIRSQHLTRGRKVSQNSVSHNANYNPNFGYNRKLMRHVTEGGLKGQLSIPNDETNGGQGDSTTKDLSAVPTQYDKSSNLAKGPNDHNGIKSKPTQSQFGSDAQNIKNQMHEEKKIIFYAAEQSLASNTLDNIPEDPSNQFHQHQKTYNKGYMNDDLGYGSIAQINEMNEQQEDDIGGENNYDDGEYDDPQYPIENEYYDENYLMEYDEDEVEFFEGHEDDEESDAESYDSRKEMKELKKMMQFMMFKIKKISVSLKNVQRQVKNNKNTMMSAANYYSHSPNSGLVGTAKIQRGMAAASGYVSQNVQRNTNNIVPQQTE